MAHDWTVESRPADLKMHAAAATAANGTGQVLKHVVADGTGPLQPRTRGEKEAFWMEAPAATSALHLPDHKKQWGVAVTRYSVCVVLMTCLGSSIYANGLINWRRPNLDDCVGWLLVHDQCCQRRRCRVRLSKCQLLWQLECHMQAYLLHLQRSR